MASLTGERERLGHIRRLAMDGLVSVIVPAFNYARFVGETLESVSRQTYGRWECIVVDDGSTDNTLEVAQSFARTEPRIRCWHQKNRGLAGTRNRGLSLATGDYVQFLDADDLISPEKLEVQTTVLASDAEVDVALSNYRPFDSDSGTLLPRFWEEPLGEDPLEDFLFRWERGLCIPIHSALFRRRALGDSPVFDERLPAKEDWLFWIDLALRGAKFHFTDADMALYRMHPHNMFRDTVNMSKAFLKAGMIAAGRIPPELQARFCDRTLDHFLAKVTPHLRPPPPSTAAAQPFSSPPPVGSSVGRRRLVCCTVIARNYLAQARVLAASFLEHEPEGIFYLLVVDGLPTGVAPPRNVRLMTAGDLGLGDLVTWRFKFGVAELCTAVKAALLSALVARHRDDDVVFLDPDILVLGRMEALRQHFERSAIVLTPHITRPIELDGRYPSEADLLATGVHNLGFIGVRWSDDALAFLRWWDERLRHACRFDFSAGYFVDQKWVDLAPVFFPSVSVLRDDTYNVAYWNLNSRRLSRRETGFLVNDRPITFFHFSGLDHVRGRFRDSRQNRIDVGAETALGELVAYYVRRLEDSGFAECSAWEYPYARFSNGAPIPAVMRALFSDLESEQRQRFADPFRAEGEASFLSWAVTPDPERGNLSPFAEKVYRLRPDVMRAYPDVQGRDRDGFLQWAVTYGAREMGYDPAIILQQTHPE